MTVNKEVVCSNENLPSISAGGSFLCRVLACLVSLVLALPAPGLELNPEPAFPVDPTLPNALTVVFIGPPEMPEAQQANFRAALEQALEKQGRLAGKQAADGALHVRIPLWYHETPAMGGRSDTLARLEAVVELKSIPGAELKASGRFSVWDVRLLARPDEALVRLAEDIARTPLQAALPADTEKPGNPVTKAAKFVAGTAAVIGIVILQVLIDNPGLAR